MTGTEKRVRSEVRTSDAQEVVNSVLSFEQGGEPHQRDAMFSAAHRALENAGYNGWTNYETWAMALWIDNDEGSYNESRDIVRRAQATSPTDAYGTERTRAADALKEWAEGPYYDAAESISGTVFADLLGSAWEQVDWYEIASNYLEEVASESE